MAAFESYLVQRWTKGNRSVNQKQLPKSSDFLAAGGRTETDRAAHQSIRRDDLYRLQQHSCIGREIMMPKKKKTAALPTWKNSPNPQ
jgi:hypothetical protein